MTIGIVHHGGSITYPTAGTRELVAQYKPAPGEIWFVETCYRWHNGDGSYNDNADIGTNTMFEITADGAAAIPATNGNKDFKARVKVGTGAGNDKDHAAKRLGAYLHSGERLDIVARSASTQSDGGTGAWEFVARRVL